ncbi:MAG: Uma2 family endonuclease [Eubacterium sp.]|nr:Uma2 family endonuclease [Eubacterium sp.]
MTVEEMKKKKKEMGLTYRQIAEKSGVPLGTVQKVFGGDTDTPRYDTLQKLSAIFTEYKPYTDTYADGSVGCVREQAAYKVNCEVGSNGVHSFSHQEEGGKTLEDYLALPDDKRVEMIDGVFYDMSSPTSLHQLIGGEIHRMLVNHVEEHEGECIPFIAPMDVQLDRDDKTIVEPDVFVVCDRSQITRPRIVGAPDLVIEVLSPSNWYHDMVRKLRKYKNAGVKEYWIILPDQSKVLVYWFAEGDLPTEYSFTDRIPVRIWDGSLEIDFNKVEKRVAFLR